MCQMAELISVFELCVRRAAVVEPRKVYAAMLAGKVAAFVDEWARMIRETGNDDPTLEEWGVWACVPERTAYRRLAEFRSLFEQWHASPTALAVAVNRAHARGRSQLVPVGLVPAR